MIIEKISVRVNEKILIIQMPPHLTSPRRGEEFFLLTLRVGMYS